MARLPIPGSDDGTWGDILNQYLSVSLSGNGSIQTGAISAAGGELTSHKGQPGGYASLDNTGNVPLDELGNVPGGGGSTPTIVQVNAGMSPYTPTHSNELDVIDVSGGDVVIDLGAMSPVDGQLYGAYIGAGGGASYEVSFTGTIAISRLLLYLVKATPFS